MPIDVYIKRLRNPSVDDSGSYGVLEVLLAVFWLTKSYCP